eukprot:Tbor_TRINITY_DN5949_c0_g1::TRINITY_DN5949_c0_g1_i1::g.18155::m.18155
MEDEMKDEDNEKENKPVPFHERLKEMKLLADTIPTDEKIRLLLHYGRQPTDSGTTPEKQGNKQGDDKYSNNIYTQAPFVCSRNFLTENCGGNYDNSDQVSIISPLTHVWMMRNSNRQYIRLLSSVDKIQRQESLEVKTARVSISILPYTPLVIRTGQKGKSCDEVCGKPEEAAIKSYSVVVVPPVVNNIFPREGSKKGNAKQLWSVNLENVYYHNEKIKGVASSQVTHALPPGIKDRMKCIPEGFLFSPMQDCQVLRATLGCTACDLGVYWRLHNGSDYPASVERTKGKKWKMGISMLKFVTTTL